MVNVGQKAKVRLGGNAGPGKGDHISGISYYLL